MVGSLRSDDWFGRVVAFDSRLRACIPFLPDPAAVELLQSPEVMLDSDVGGDCDDFVIAGCALAESVGIATMIGLAGSDGVAKHAFAMVQDPYSGRWVPVDFGGPSPPGDWPEWPERWLA